MEIYSPPPILVLHLKRFENRGFWAGRKITKKVAFPLEGLDLAEFVTGHGKAGPLIYDLYAVTVRPTLRTGTNFLRSPPF